MISENTNNVGKRVETPHLGDPFDVGLYEGDKTMRAILQIPKDLPEKLVNRSLVIELDVDLSQEEGLVEEVRYSSKIEYKLVEQRKTWKDAEAYCQNEGGNLASIHSEEEQRLVNKVAHDWKTMWIGGLYKDEQWRWSDNSQWNFHDHQYNQHLVRNYGSNNASILLVS